MALRINLYHEIEAAKQERRRDPLKLGMLGVLLIVLLCMGWYGLRYMQVSKVVAERIQAEAEWRDYEKRAAAAHVRTAELKELLRTDTILRQFTENRFFWAPELQNLLQAIPPYVQIDGLSCMARIDEASAEPPKDFSMILSGRAAGEVPLITSEEFRKELAKHFTKGDRKATAEFPSRQLNETSDTVKLSGSTLKIATFTISLGVQGGQKGATK